MHTECMVPIYTHLHQTIAFKKSRFFFFFFFNLVSPDHFLTLPKLVVKQTLQCSFLLLQRFLVTQVKLTNVHLPFIKSQLATAAAAATAVTPSSIEHTVAPMQQSTVQHLANQMNQLQMSGSQYITSPVHSSFSQASWQMMHQHGQPHPHYMSLEVQLYEISSVI